MFGWSIRASPGAPGPFRLEAGQHAGRVHPRLDDFDGHAAFDRVRLVGHEDRPHAPLADFLEQFVLAGDD
jgi:hypothetical protein